MTVETFQCGLCRKVFPRKMSQEELNAQYLAEFGMEPGEDPGGEVEVCDPCFQILMAVEADA